MAKRARHLAAAIATAAVMVIAGCGDDAATPPATSDRAPTTTTGAVTIVASSVPASTSVGATTVTTGAVTIEIGYAGGTITGGGKRSAARGQAVVIKVTSDIADEIHLHGYDKKANVAPGTVATITFLADKPGIFEVELEKKGLRLFELEVK